MTTVGTERKVMPWVDWLDVTTALLGHPWRFATTMPESPHWYTLRRKWNRQDSFDKCVQAIREYGYDGHYGGQTYKYMNINGMRYWTMGAPVDETILINRAHLDEPCPYDGIAHEYDLLFSAEEYINENEEVIEMMGDTYGRLLDIGCATGLFLDYCAIRPEFYQGIDPSRAMLECLKQKHAGQADNVIPTAFEDFIGYGYNHIIALFGSASYIHPDFLHRIPWMLAPGGRLFLMFYKPGYRPVSHDVLGDQPPYYGIGKEAPDGWVSELLCPDDEGPGIMVKVKQWHNYVIVEGTI